MLNDPVIREIRADQVTQARRLVYTVARDLFHPEMSVEEATAYWDAQGVLKDMDDVQKSYFENGGAFLVIMDGKRMVGTGAFHRHAGEACELRRLYLLPEYQGRGLGYAMLMEILRRAQAMGYQKMCLLTDRYAQSRAVGFYHRLGFVDVPRAGAGEEDLWMERGL